MTLPDCGLYRTTADIGPVPAGRLVYFHNHGEPGPGIYLPDSWQHNRAIFSKKGNTLPDDDAALNLEALAPEGLYRVQSAFTCCSRNCHNYEVGLLTQLGYDGKGQAILFVPEWTERGLAFPATGQPLDPGRVQLLELLKVAHSHQTPPGELH